MTTRQKLKDGTTLITGANFTMSDILTAVRDAFYPVGKIYISTDSASPAATLGGTWVAWGSGRVPVGVDPAQFEFDTVEEIGGTKSEVLTTAQMPTHNHGGSTTSRTVPAGNSSTTAGATTGTIYVTRATSSGALTSAAISDSDHTHGISSDGSGLGHNNLQPYITCYMWKRTA